MKLLLLLSLFQQTGSAGKATPDTARVKQMGEVIIRAQKPVYEQNAYGTIVNVGNDVLTPGSSALEALQRSPGIRLDPRYNTLSLNGKSGITILINGKLTHLSPTQLMTFLNGMNADDIERIEIMNTPPANFDAAGSAGVINIVLKKNKRLGNHGSLSLSGGYGQYEKASGSVRLEHNTRKMELYGAYSYSHDHGASQLIAGGTEVLPQWDGTTTFTYGGEGESLSNSQIARGGLTAHLDAKTTLGGELFYNYARSSYHSLNRASYAFPPDSTFAFEGDIHSASTWKGAYGTVNLERQFKGSDKLTVSLEYDHDIASTRSSVLSTFLDEQGAPVDPGDTAFAPQQQGFSGIHQDEGEVKIDYSGQLGKRVTLETGIKGDYSSTLSSSGLLSLVNGVWVDRGGTTTTNLLVREGIGAAYASFHIRLDTTTTLIAGVRYEFSNTRGSTASAGDTLNRTLNGLFPDIFLSKKLDDRQTLVASYTKRITRPSFDDLAPSVGYNDPVSVFTGNPLLRPTITHTLKLGYSNRGYSLSVFASRDNYPIARYQVVAHPGSDLVYIEPQNLDYQNSLMFQAVLPVRVTSWWNINTSLSAGWTQFKASYNPVPFSRTYAAGSANVTSTVTLPRRFVFEVYGNYTTPGYSSTSYNYWNAALSMGIKKTIDARSNLLLSVTDLCRMQYQSYLGAVTTDAFHSNVWVTYRPESWVRPVLKVSYVRTFGEGR
jgi:hypothetical protein